MNKDIKIVLFGTSDFSVLVFDRLAERGFIPALVVTEPDRPKGRGLKLVAPAVKKWAVKNGFPSIQPSGKFDDALVLELSALQPDLFIVASYGKILPKKIISIPKKGALNVHPSLLPKYRGPSPIQSAILSDEKRNGVTIILMDEKVDHGPIIGKKEVDLKKWPIVSTELAKVLGIVGGDLLAELLEPWLTGKIEPAAQDDAQATFTKMITREDGLIDIKAPGYSNWLKFNAYSEWPGIFFVAEHSKKKFRIKITSAQYEDGRFKILKVVPEGKREMPYGDFIRGYGI